MRAHAVSTLPLWDTEGSWGDSGMGDDSHRAAFLAKYYVLQWSQGVAASCGMPTTTSISGED
jgi:hypothetical protein